MAHHLLQPFVLSRVFVEMARKYRRSNNKAMQLAWLVFLDHKWRLLKKKKKWDQCTGFFYYLNVKEKINVALSFLSCWIAYHFLAAWCSIEDKQAFKGPPLRDQGRSAQMSLVQVQVQVMLTSKHKCQRKLRTTETNLASVYMNIQPLHASFTVPLVSLMCKQELLASLPILCPLEEMRVKWCDISFAPPVQRQNCMHL